MRIWFTVLILLACSAIADNFVHLGKGCTTGFYIDVDCDGYGVGQNFLLGPDADDSDPTVNTLASVNTRYGDIDYLGNLTAFLQARGYPWDYTINDVYYMSENGNDTTGTVNDVSFPFATFYGFRASLSPGDLILMRAGVNDGFDLNYGGETNGNESHGHIIAMAYPGEQAHIYSGPYSSAAVSILPSNPSQERKYWIFDGMILGDLDNSLSGYAVNGGDFQNMIFRNLEIPRRGSAIYCFQDMHNILVERSVMYDSTATHTIYVGSREYPNSNMTFRDIIIYNGSSEAEYTPAFQHNGRVANLTLEGSIFHTNGAVGVAILSGMDNSTIRNNLIFNNNKNALQIGKYHENYGDANNDNNLIVNNIIWSGRYENAFGQGYDPYAAISFHNSFDADPHYGNIFRNNIIVTYDDATFNTDQNNHVSTSVVENNIMYRMDTTDIVVTSTEAPNTWTFAEFEAISANIRNNLFYDNDSFFLNVSEDFYLQPELFNFNHTQDSDAIDFGVLTDAPTIDLRDDPRSGNPDAGCYEYQSQYHAADSDEDGNVNTAELKDYIWLWKGGIVSISSMSSAIFEWKTG